MKNIPGFTAEIACNSSSMTYYRSLTGYNSMIIATVNPQLWIEAPMWNCIDGICKNSSTNIWYDDSGGPAVYPGIGDVAERQCFARCKKIRNPIVREACLDNC